MNISVGHSQVHHGNTLISFIMLSPAFKSYLHLLKRDIWFLKCWNIKHTAWEDVFVSFASLVSKMKWLLMTHIQLSSEYQGLVHTVLENYQVTETLKFNLSISRVYYSSARETTGLLCMRWLGSFFLSLPKLYQNKAVRRQSVSVKLLKTCFRVLTPRQSLAVLSWLCFGTGSRVFPGKRGGDRMP